MYKFKPSSKFRKQYKRLNRKDKETAKKVINKLLSGEILEPKYKDHKLIGDYKDCRECHIKPDLLLIYKKENKNLILILSIEFLFLYFLYHKTPYSLILMNKLLK